MAKMRIPLYKNVAYMSILHKIRYDPLTCTELAKLCHKSQPVVREQVIYMYNVGLVERICKRNKQNEKLFYATEKGEALCQLNHVWRDLMRKIDRIEPTFESIERRYEELINGICR